MFSKFLFIIACSYYDYFKNGTQEKLRDTLPWKAGSLVFTKKQIWKLENCRSSVFQGDYSEDLCLRSQAGTLTPKDP